MERRRLACEMVDSPPGCHPSDSRGGCPTSRCPSTVNLSLLACGVNGRPTIAENMAYSSGDRRTLLAVAGYYFFSLAGLAISSPYLPLYWKSLGYRNGEVG